MIIPRIRPETNYLDILQSLFVGAEYKLKLEKELKQFFEVDNVILTQAARAGLYFLLKVLPNRTVFLPAYTCWVVPEAVKLANKEIIYVDINLSDYNINVTDLRNKIKPKSIIIATHQFGIPCDINEIKEIADRYDCILIEDNAAGFGSRYHNKLTGTFGVASIISFEYSKVLSSGIGGAILFRDEDLYLKVKSIYETEILKPSFQSRFKPLFKTFLYKMFTQKLIFSIFTYPLFRRIKGLTTSVPQFNTTVIQKDPLYCYDISNNQAKLAYLNMKKISRVIEKRIQIEQFYQESLSGISGVVHPKYSVFKKPCFMRYPIRVEKIDKVQFYEMVALQGIDLAFTFSYTCTLKESCSQSNVAASTVLNLPLYSQLQLTDLIKIAGIIKNAISKSEKNE